MAVYLMRWPATLLLLACLSFGHSVWALGPGAPFTPPKLISASDAATAPGAAASAADPAHTAAAAPDVTGLTGLRLRHRPLALIDGQWWQVGDQVRGARLHAISRAGATLRHPDGRSELLAWNAMTSPAAPTAGRASLDLRAPSP